VGLNSQLTQVDERSSECGFKENLDRKEFEYLEEIDGLQRRIEDINKITALTQKGIDEKLAENKNLQKNTQLLSEKKLRVAQMEKRSELLGGSLDCFVDHEKTLKYCIEKSHSGFINLENIKQL